MDTVTSISGRPAQVANLILGVALAGIMAIEFVLSGAPSRDRWIGLGISVAAAGPALARERNRAWAVAGGLTIGALAATGSLAAGLPSQPGFATAAALLVLGASYVRTGPPRRGWLVAGAGLLVLTVGRIDLRAGLLGPAILVGFLAWGAALGIGVWLRSLDTQRRASIDAARRDERLDLARELHDAVAHQIAAIVVQSQAAQLAVAKGSPQLPAVLAEIESTGGDALIAMRRVIGLLRDADGPQAAPPGAEQLAELVTRFAARGRPVEAHLPDDQDAWAPEIRTTVYRVTQEALTNIARHAPEARDVRVVVHQNGPGLRIEVTDDGPGRPPGPPWSSPGGYGLVGMRERVEALGGQLQAGPHPNGGWTVLATVPTVSASAHAGATR